MVREIGDSHAGLAGVSRQLGADALSRVVRERDADHRLVVAGDLSAGRFLEQGSQVGDEADALGDGGERAVQVCAVDEVGRGDEQVDPGESEVVTPEKSGELAPGGAIQLAGAQVGHGAVEVNAGDAQRASEMQRGPELVGRRSIVVAFESQAEDRQAERDVGGHEAHRAIIGVRRRRPARIEAIPSTMSTARAALSVVNTTAIGLWLGTIVMTGATAAIIFPTVRDLAPTLPSHTTFTGDHWLIVAGHVAARVFLVSDIVQFACACVAILTLAALLIPTVLRSRLSIETWARALTLALACGLLGYQLLILSPSMTLELRAYWEAARTGQNELAAVHQAAFTKLHPRASTLLSTLALSVLAALLMSASAGTSGRPGGNAITPGSQ